MWPHSPFKMILLGLSYPSPTLWISTVDKGGSSTVSEAAWLRLLPKGGAADLHLWPRWANPPRCGTSLKQQVFINRIAFQLLPILLTPTDGGTPHIKDTPDEILLSASHVPVMLWQQWVRNDEPQPHAQFPPASRDRVLQKLLCPNKRGKATVICPQFSRVLEILVSARDLLGFLLQQGWTFASADPLWQS